METFEKETSFHGIQLDSLFNYVDSKRKQELSEIVTDGVKCGAVKPLCTSVFQKDQVEAAFRYCFFASQVNYIYLTKVK